MAQIITAELQAYDPALPGVRTLYYATQGYVSRAADTPANTWYDGRIKQPANVQRALTSRGATTGVSQIGFGELVLVNADGALDGLLNYSFAGRSITIRLGEVLPNSGGVPVWTTVLAGTMEQAEFSWREVRVRVRDRLQDIAKPHIATRYLGNNSLPAGLEGVAGDIAGRPKPRVYGQVFNVSPPQVNTARLIYQLHHGSALQSVDAVYDRGVPLTAGAAYTSQADMEATAPAANQYRVWNSGAGTFFRLGTKPTGTVTADCTQGASTAARTAAQVANNLLLDAGIASGSISSADITALDALVAYPVGIFFGHRDDKTTLQALDEVLGSVGAWCTPDSVGVFRFGRIDLPTSGSVGTLTATDIIAIDRTASRDPGVGIPAFKVKLGYRRFWETQRDVGTTVTAARTAELEQAFRRVEVSDSAVLTANATSPELSFDTLLVNAADATAEANRRLTLYKARRDLITVRVRVDRALAAVLDLGKVVTLQLPRYGLGAGKLFLITALRTDMRGYIFELTLWG